MTSFPKYIKKTTLLIVAEQVIYVDKLTGKEKAEPGYLPLETGYPEGIEPGSEAATYILWDWTSFTKLFRC